MPYRSSTSSALAPTSLSSSDPAARTNSSSAVPRTSPLSAPTPAATASVRGRATRSPSITGPQSIRPRATSRWNSGSGSFPANSSRCSALIVDKPAVVGATPAAAATRRPTSSASSSEMSAVAADSAQTRWKRCCAAGIVSSRSTASPPADWPAIVTRPGSPPNAAMFCWAHSRASSQSSTPRLSGASSIQPNPSNPSR
jgi:hypothetical protein